MSATKTAKLPTADTFAKALEAKGARVALGFVLLDLDALVTHTNGLRDQLIKAHGTDPDKRPLWTTPAIERLAQNSDTLLVIRGRVNKAMQAAARREKAARASFDAEAKVA